MACTCLTLISFAAILTAAPDPWEANPAPRKELTDLSLEELLEVNVTVSVASLFDESELLLGSTVERIGRARP
jgi:hypothetical protein